MEQRDAVGRVARQRQRPLDRTVSAWAEIDRDSHMSEPFAWADLPPRDQQDRYRGLRDDTLGDGSDSKPVDPPALVRPEHDHVRTERTRVEEDDLRGVSSLNPVCEFDVRLFGLVPKDRRQRATVMRVPAKGLIRRDGLDHNQFGAVVLTERERVLERTARRLREVHRCEDARDVIQNAASKDGVGRVRSRQIPFEKARGKPTASPRAQREKIPCMCELRDVGGSSTRRAGAHGRFDLKWLGQPEMP